jgi:dephospho-CoA kinase
MAKRPFVLGLTGGIACGKSTVAEMLKSKGWQVIDADQIAHNLMMPGKKNWKLIVDSFGKSILSQSKQIDRAALGARVFKNPRDLQRLNQITHPEICETCVSLIKKFREKPNADRLLVVVPLLHEIGFTDHWDAIAVVAASLAKQKERLLQRGLDSQGAEDRLASQWPVSEKVSRSDYVLWNDGSLEILQKQIDQLLAQI